jgi:hypothetical protein
MPARVRVATSEAPLPALARHVLRLLLVPPTNLDQRTRVHQNAAISVPCLTWEQLSAAGAATTAGRPPDGSTGSRYQTVGIRRLPIGTVQRVTANGSGGSAGGSEYFVAHWWHACLVHGALGQYNDGEILRWHV